MMMNLFSMFDPSSSLNSVLWVTVLIPTILYMKSKMKSQLKLNSLLNMVHIAVEKEIKTLINKKNMKGSISSLKSMFMVILLMNLLAMWPFIFTPTAHMSISFSTALILWSSIIVFGWINFPKSMVIHTLPSGTPTPLMNFMVLIELVSNVIRPITLSIRLTANMIAGHLLMSLLGDFMMKSMSNFTLAIPGSLILTILELAVAMIQAYVFSILLTMYFNEI